ncbi:MAG: cell division protein FtsA, partial [Candidatus Margulisiibacteriota bacterium]
MSKPNIIAGIDIGTSKISVIVCALKSSDDIEILGMGTSILKGVQKGIIVDKSLFTNALQNC